MDLDIFQNLLRKQKTFQRKREEKLPIFFRIDKIESRSERMPPPDETAPQFDWYDKEIGKCENKNDYKYKTWLRIVDWKKVLL